MNSPMSSRSDNIRVRGLVRRKVRDGPMLEKCEEQSPVESMRRLSSLGCLEETDLLVICIRKGPPNARWRL